MVRAHPQHIALEFRNMTAFPAFLDILQQGFLVELSPNTTIRNFLKAFCPEDDPEALSRIQTLFLNGKPVDDMDSAIPSHGDSLALSAAMPGLVGATMRAGGLLAGFRQTISFRPQSGGQVPGKGFIRIKLFNLLIKELGPAFLARGIFIPYDDLQQLIRNLIRSCHRADVSIALDGASLSLAHLAAMEWFDPGDMIRMTAHFVPARNP